MVTIFSFAQSTVNLQSTANAFEQLKSFARIPLTT